MDKPREFWITKGTYDGDMKEGRFYSSVFEEQDLQDLFESEKKEFTHVIEKSAYEQLKKSYDLLTTCHEIVCRDRDNAVAKLKIAVEALERLHKLVGSCAYSNTDKWGGVLESVYRTTQKAREKIKPGVDQSQPVSSPWQPIETAPKDGRWIVVEFDYGGKFSEVVRFGGIYWENNAGDGYGPEKARRWFPLPKSKNGEHG